MALLRWYYSKCSLMGNPLGNKLFLPKFTESQSSESELVEEMNGKLSIEDRFLLKQSLNHCSHKANKLEEITSLIEHYILEIFEREYYFLIELPRVRAIVAFVILSKIDPNVEAFHSLYSRISGRSSNMKALIACAHKVIRLIYKILSTGERYDTKKF